VAPLRFLCAFYAPFLCASFAPLLQRRHSNHWPDQTGATVCARMCLFATCHLPLDKQTHRRANKQTQLGKKQLDNNNCKIGWQKVVNCWPASGKREREILGGFLWLRSRQERRRNQNGPLAASGFALDSALASDFLALLAALFPADKQLEESIFAPNHWPPLNGGSFSFRDSLLSPLLLHSAGTLTEAQLKLWAAGSL